MGISQGYEETSRMKNVAQQIDVQNRNQVSMFSISSMGVNNKTSGSEISNSRVHHQLNEQSQLASNLGGMGNNTFLINNHQAPLNNIRP